MRRTIFFLPASIVALVSAQTQPGTTFLGEKCNPADQSPCVYGSQCYATNSMLIPSCGNFQAGCQNNAQCAFNTCNNGFCNGPPSNGTVALGDPCSPKLPGQCANGANCYSTNSGLIPACGNFQASCDKDSQCVFNTCNNGLCNGAPTTSKPTGATSTSSPLTKAGVVYSNTTSATVPVSTGYTTSVVVVGGKTTSVLVNAAGSTTSFNPTVSPTASLQSGGVSKSVNGLGALVLVGLGFALL